MLFRLLSSTRQGFGLSTFHGRDLTPDLRCIEPKLLTQMSGFYQQFNAHALEWLTITNKIGFLQLKYLHLHDGSREVRPHTLLRLYRYSDRSQRVKFKEHYSGLWTVSHGYWQYFPEGKLEIAFHYKGEEDNRQTHVFNRTEIFPLQFSMRKLERDRADSIQLTFDSENSGTWHLKPEKVLLTQLDMHLSDQGVTYFCV